MEWSRAYVGLKYMHLIEIDGLLLSPDSLLLDSDRQCSSIYKILLVLFTCVQLSAALICLHDGVAIKAHDVGMRIDEAKHETAIYYLLWSLIKSVNEMEMSM